VVTGELKLDMLKPGAKNIDHTQKHLNFKLWSNGSLWRGKEIGIVIGSEVL
jgi:hypothetical protein